MIDQIKVFDIYPGGSASNPQYLSSNPRYLTSVNGKLFFIANDGSNGTELWKSDGTETGTTLVKDINPSSSSFPYPSNLTNVNGTLFFTANDGSNGTELWKSDGTAAGTTLVKDINPGNNSAFSSFYSYQPNLTNVNGTLFFTANDGTHGTELWKSDGTEAGTTLVKDIYLGSSPYYSSPYSSNPQNLTNVNGTLFFTANDGSKGIELWKSDGTAAGTTLVADLNPWSSSNPSNLTNVNGTLFFTANDGSKGIELWKSDGTAAGTTLVADIYSGYNPSNPKHLTNVNGTLFFTANDGINGTELWKSDGTAAGTTLVKDIYPGNSGSGYPSPYPNSSNPSNLTNVNGTLFFTANDGINGKELWKSDGTTAGTTLVADLNPGSDSAFSDFWNPNANLTVVNNNLFFTANDGTHGIELFHLSLDPVANNDSVTVTQNTPIRINVLANDSDPDTSFSITDFTEGTNGSVELNENNTPADGSDDFLIYTPDRKFTGSDSFTYTISDGNGGTATATVSLEVGTILNGTKRADNLIGTLGNDRINGRKGSDRILGLAGDDTLIGGTQIDTLIGGIGDDSLSGGKGNDILSGGSDNDILVGGKGDDVLSGDSGNDILIGSDGNNVLSGGNGKDIFVLPAEVGTDIIIDFTIGEDVIGLSGTMSFSDLILTGNNIEFGGRTIAVLSEVNTATLTSEDFIQPFLF